MCGLLYLLCRAVTPFLRDIVEDHKTHQQHQHNQSDLQHSLFDSETQRQTEKAEERLEQNHENQTGIEYRYEELIEKDQVKSQQRCQSDYLTRAIPRRLSEDL